MTNMVKTAQNELEQCLDTALKKCMEKNIFVECEIPTYKVEIPTDTSHGDFTSNIAFVSAKALKSSPQNIAEQILDNICFDGTYIKSAEIAGPGFINFSVNDKWFGEVINGIVTDKEEYGKSDIGKGKRVNVEFVSANPTGPMHMGNARGGALGDGIAAALEYTGHDVFREFYVNDAGNQIAKFGMSLEARYIQQLKGEDAVEFPEDGYQGADIIDLAKMYIDKYGDKLMNVDSATRRKALSDFAVPINVENLKNDLLKYRIKYDLWFHESTLHESGAVDATLEFLKKNGVTYEKDGAVWLKTDSENDDDKDNVLVRANGFPTYFAVDIAYHYNKLITRGFDKAIDIWGTDHHGHVERMKRAVAAMGCEGKLDVVLLQLVRLMQDGKVAKMSKRTGKAITLSDLLEEVPIDSARFFFNMREPSTHMDFDLDLAVKEDSDNPVYYVQYAYARICSIIKNLSAEGYDRRDCSADELLLLSSPEEVALTRFLAELPNVIIDAATNYNPAVITRYIIDLATKYHKFYSACRVKGQDEGLLQARLNLCYCCQLVFKNILSMLKISALEVM